MGLETADLVMRVEDDFRILIPERPDKPMRTVGSLYDFIMAELSKRETPDADAVWKHLVKLICEVGRVPETRIRKEARFEEDLGMG